jgi:hypothetical protein
MREDIARPVAQGVGLSLLTLSLLGLVVCVFTHIARTHGPGWDQAYLTVAGTCWAAGQTPYAAETYVPRIEAASPNPDPDRFFAYPPTAAPLALGLVGLPEAGRWPIWVSVNLLGALGLAWVLARWLQRRDPGRGFWAAFGPWAVAAMVLANPATWDALHLGQPTPLLLLALVAGWYWVYGGRPWLGGALLGLGLIKPPVMALPLLWLALERRWRPLVIAGAVALALASYPILLHGPIAPLAGWFEQMHAYQGPSFNQYGSDDLFGLMSLVAALGVSVPSPTTVLALFALALVAGYWFLPRRRPLEVLAVLITLYVGCIYAHRYDLMMLAVALAVGWPYLRPRAWRVGAAGLLIAGIWLPERLLLMFGPVPALALHYRSVALSLAMIGFVVLIGCCGRARSGVGQKTIVEPTAPEPAPGQTA